MDRKTLLLSSNYFPIQVLHWQQAVKLKYEGTAEVVLEYGDEIRGASVTWKWPAVMRLVAEKGETRRRVKFSRLNVYTRDHFRCAYCRKKFAFADLTFDHVVPRRRGGRTEWQNIVAACRPCNGRKGDRSCDESGMWPAIEPIRPTALPPPSPRIDPATAPPEWDGFVSF
jgi:5-methylcytosine-specific restriction endonuclease McrA